MNILNEEWNIYKQTLGFVKALVLHAYLMFSDYVIISFSKCF